MNESQARQLRMVYEDMGYETNWEQTGGNVWLVTVFNRTNNTITVFGNDTVTHYVDGEIAAEVLL
jgi:hypothetical protein